MGMTFTETTDLDIGTVQLVFEHIDTPIIVSNMARQFVYMNQSARSLFGYSNSDVVGKSTILLYANDSDYDKQGLRRFNAHTNYSDSTDAVDYINSNGHVFKGQLSGGAIKDRNGQPQFFVAIIKDDSHRVAAEVALNKLHAITSSRDLNFEQRVKAILNLGCEHFGLPIGIFSKIDGEKYVIQYAVHPDDALDSGLTFELGVTYCSHVYQANDVQGFNHVSHSRIATHPCFSSFGLEAYLGAPIFVDGQRYGTLNFSSPESTRSFTGQDIELVRMFAEWVGHEIARNNDIGALKRAHNQLKVVANTDALTQLSNRGCTECILKKQVNLSHQYEKDLVVAIFDFDHFKAINDNFGHNAGDAALKHFSRLVSEFCRADDLYGRWGGEEFLAIYPNTNKVGVEKLLNRLLVKLKEQGVEFEGETIPLTVSVGVAQLVKNDSADSLLSRADQALYRAKDKGRDRIEFG
ncbi:diguanylate cyclase [Vibrio tapetis subsp. quintayensis]|uniref:bifunctional diguanylate cyclase/phosphodiesterase n=1 Tax=Vibrio tapetis TaxID=52443 RepID=UPI0025B2F81E|nr:diguanylate cyclase [Vibrio tapetis]MDN3679279.1 diguanylate cyclase [Vibrio tapetis subsp. quintayensis]